MNYFSIIMGLTDLAITLMGKIGALKQVAKQKGELTPEQEQELDQRMQAGFNSPAWQPSTPPPARPG